MSKEPITKINLPGADVLRDILNSMARNLDRGMDRDEAIETAILEIVCYENETAANQ